MRGVGNEAVKPSEAKSKWPTVCGLVFSFGVGWILSLMVACLPARSYTPLDVPPLPQVSAVADAGGKRDTRRKEVACSRG